MWNKIFIVKWYIKRYSPVSFLCDSCHSIYHKVVLIPDIFSPDYLWNSKFRIWVWARLVKRSDLSVLTYQWSSQMSQCLRNILVTRGRHTLVHFKAKIPLPMHKTAPDVTPAVAWNKFKHHLGDGCHYISLQNICRTEHWNHKNSWTEHQNQKMRPVQQKPHLMWSECLAKFVENCICIYNTKWIDWHMIFGFNRSHGAGTSSPSHWQQVEEQAPKPVAWMMCFFLMTFIPVQELCVNIYICY